MCTAAVCVDHELPAAADVDDVSDLRARHAWRSSAPYYVDTDGDGLPDSVEISLGGDPSAPDRCFLPRTGFAASDARDVELADLDSDGILDVAWFGDDAGWAPGLGDGTFGPRVVIESPPFSGSLLPGWPFEPVRGLLTWIRAADLDADGDLDLLTSWREWDDNSFYLAEELALWINDGAGNFSQLARWNQLNGGAVAVADVDGDGHVDVLGGWGSDLYLFLGPTFGVNSFTRVALNYQVPKDFLDIRATDLDGDGDPDLLWAGIEGAGALEHVGGAVLDIFLLDVLPTPSLDDTWSFELGDVDGDGIDDMVRASSEYGLIYGTSSPVVEVHPGLGGLSFGGAVTVLETWSGWVDVALGDTDGDGTDDVWIALDGFIDQVHVVEKNQTTILALAGDPHDLALADLDGNGDLDAVVALHAVGVGTLLQQHEGDFDGDGLTDGVEACVYGTHPRDRDTDGGGASDRDEAWAGTDPLDSWDDSPTATGHTGLGPTGDTGTPQDTATTAGQPPPVPAATDGNCGCAGSSVPLTPWWPVGVFAALVRRSRRG